MTGIVAGVATRALLGKVAGGALGGLKAAGGWLSRRKPIELLCMALAIALVIQHVADRRHEHASVAAATAEQKRADDAAFTAAMRHVAEQANAIRQKAEQVSAAITNHVRTNYENQARDIGTRADSVRVRGPGAAASHCGPFDRPGVPAAASAARPASGSGDAAGSPVPPGDWASVPWSWLTNHAEQADLDRAEVLAWRSWYQQQAAAWEKEQAQPPK